MTRLRYVPEPRRLTAQQAAAYLGYKTTDLLAEIPVKPRALVPTGPGSAPMYDRVELDAWLDRLAGLSVPAAGGEQGGRDGDAEAAYSAWRATRAAG
jgi:hypothetical protein